MLRFTILHREGFPIRKSVGRSLFAAHHSLSQLITSFIGSWCQGIHLTLLFAWTSCIMYLTILWFSLNCLSFFELYVQDFIDSCSHEKTFIRLLHLFLSCAFRAFHLSVKLYFPFRLERLIISLRLFVLFCSFLLKSFFYSIVKDQMRSCDRRTHRRWVLWSVWMDSNHRPRAYQARALATWATNRN